MNSFSAGLVDQLDASLPAGPPVETGGSLLTMVGLPGAGKSFVARHLRRLVPFTLVSTDHVRRLIQERPTYTEAAMARNYEVCFSLIERRLGRNQRVVFDGSNYLAARRERLREMARRHRVPYTMVHVHATEEVTRARLLQRGRSPVSAQDLSDAGWPVYRWMVAAQEPLADPHLVLDTSITPVEILSAQLYQYWMESERNFTPANDYL